MEKITLSRTGNRPLAFTGEQIASISGDRNSVNRWHNIAVYRTKADKTIVAIEYHTQWQGELPAFIVEACDSLPEAVEYLRDYELGMRKHVTGYPPGEPYREKQERLLEDLRRRYRAQITEIMDELPDVAEEIE